MPKMKTKSGAKKRFRTTGSGKIRRARGNHNHILATKNAKRGRRLRTFALVDASNQSQVERMLLK